MAGNDDYDRALAEILKAIGDWLNSFNWKTCPSPCDECKHNPKMERHVGAPVGGHRQFSCPCRLARQAGRQVSCDCEWTFDEPAKWNPF